MPREMFSGMVKHWDAPLEQEPISQDDLRVVVDEIKNDFDKGGHTT
jgi:hypothetical protein